MTVKIKATPCIAKNLQLGDLFSTMGLDYWDNVLSTGAVGERVYIRVGGRATTANGGDEQVFRIEVLRDSEEQS